MTFRTAARFLLVLAVAPLAQACGVRDDVENASDALSEGVASNATLELAVDLGVRNARMPMPGVLTGGQPTEEQFDALSEAGFTRFISLRPTDESGAGWEENHGGGAPHDFSRLPISGAESLTRENVETFAALLAQRGDEPTVLYCASGNRVGAMLALKAHWVDGVGAEEALAVGLDGGMTRLEGPVRGLLGLNPGE